MKRYVTFLRLTALAACLLGTNCRHNPVYPAIGTLYIYSNPTGAEVIIDGQLTRRKTPLKLDGVSAGDHEVRLRYYGFKVSRTTVTISGGMTKRELIKLEPIRPRHVSSISLYQYSRHMAYDPGSGRIAVAAKTYFLTELQLHDSVVVPFRTVQLQQGSYPFPGPGQKLVALSPAAGKTYVGLLMDSVIVVGFTSGTIIKRFKPSYGVDSTNFVQMRFSADGRTAYIADSTNKRIWVIDATRDSTTGYFPLTGAPSDFLCDPQRGKLYVTLVTPVSQWKVVELDAASGAVTRSAFTEYRPVGLCADLNWQKISYGCGLLDQKRPMTLDLATWAVATGPVMNDGNDMMLGAAFGHDQTHLWVISSYTPWWDGDRFVGAPGSLDLVYLPDQNYVTRYDLSLHPVTAAQTPDGRYLIVLHGCFDMTNGIDVYYTDTQ